MKVSKKICIYFLVSVLCFCSVVCNYDKANSCEAVSVGLGVGLAAIFTGVVLYGSYCIAMDENVQEEVKQTFTDYKNMTVEGAKKSYETNKQLFNDFISYAQEQGSGSACLYSSAGSAYSIDDLSKAGFPEFDDWDEYFKKASDDSSNGGKWGHLWDAVSLGADIIGLLHNFCNDNFYKNGINGQLFYTGDDGYYNAETGECNIYFESRQYGNNGIGSYQTHIAKFVGSVFDENPDILLDTFRCCAYAESYYYWVQVNSNGVSNISYTQLWRVYFKVAYQDKWGNNRLYDFYLPVSLDGGNFSRQRHTYCTFGLYFWDAETNRNTFNGSYSELPYYPDYISANIPFFGTYSEAYSYLMGNDKTPTNVIESTPSDVFINNYNNTYVTPNDVITDVKNYYSPADPSVTPSAVVSAAPVPTLPDDDGSNTTNNYIINITNILQPIQETVNNIYNFFVIDTEQISYELEKINVTPASKFKNFIAVFTGLRTTFSDEPQEALLASGSTQRGIVYPILKVQCPNILIDFLPVADEEGNTVVCYVDDIPFIILCDCSKYAVQFSAVRTLLKAVMWFGFIFYLLKELKVVITLSS